MLRILCYAVRLRCTINGYHRCNLSPYPVQEVIELYFQDSAAKLERLSTKLSESTPDYAEVDALVHQFKGSSASFGAQAITQRCVQVKPNKLQVTRGLPWTRSIGYSFKLRQIFNEFLGMEDKGMESKHPCEMDYSCKEIFYKNIAASIARHLTYLLLCLPMSNWESC